MSVDNDRVPATPGPSGEASTTVARVSVRIPEFCATDPEMWFAMVERSFEASGVTTEGTKFGYVLGALSPVYAAEVRDIIMNPPTAGPYQKLKAELIRRLSSTQEQKTRRLLESEEIGDRKPSQFLRHLRGLAGTTVSDSVLRTLWMGRLPTNMQIILATQKDVDLVKVADLADAIAETTGPRVHIAESAAPVGAPKATGQHNVTQDLEALLNLKMAQLAVSFRQEIAAMRQELLSEGRSSRFERTYRQRSPSRQRTRQRSVSRRRAEERQGRCFYHWRWGAGAHRCVPPCNWNDTAGNESGGR
ncbi:uncharacterized protein LOC143186447 [Calliopsis andreniformis]|uniref:uncharacterized protein LOC143186447 n=1 Tax=Calliopsis andreniformis TaxID=337506 RepID=UPI003FCE5F7A